MTLQIEDLVEMFRKAGFVQGADGKPASAPLKAQDVIASVERFYSPEQRLESKLSNEALFEAFLLANPSLVPLRNSAGEEDSEEMRLKVEEEIQAARAKWVKQVICEHLVSLRGVELVYFEFREVLMDMAVHRLRDTLDPKRTGKVKGLLTKFLDEHLLKRIGALIRSAKAKLQVSDVSTGAQATRAWPESEKDRLIRLKMEERRKAEEEERLRQEELRRIEEEQRALQQAEAEAEETEEQARLRLAQQEEGEGARQEEQPEEDEAEEEEEPDEDVENEDDEDY